MLDPKAILYYADHPVAFTEDIICVRPDNEQAEIMHSVAEYQKTTVRSGHGIGKSAVESWLIIWFLCTRPFPKIPCTAPTKHQLHDILWAEIAKWIRSNPLINEVLTWTQEKVYMNGHPEDWYAVPRTATSPEALQGFHADHVLYIIDEASGVEDKTFEPVLGALSTAGAKLLMCGNPTRLTGFFYDSHHKNRTTYKTHHVDGRSSPRVSMEFVRTIIDMYGEDSDVFRVRVAGEFPKALPDSFIAMEWCERNSAKEIPIISPKRIDIGVDVARYGDDSSVLCPVFDRKVQQEPEIYHHNDTMEISGHVIAMIKRYAKTTKARSINVKVDCGGLGVGVYDRIHEQLDALSEAINEHRKEEAKLEINIYECQFGGEGGTVSENDPVEYENSTGVMWGAIRDALRENRLTLYYDDRQIAQLSNRKYSVNSKGNIELERKEAMKKRGLPSPDMGDALALALYEPYVLSWTIA